MSEEATFNKLAEPTYHLMVEYESLEDELFDEILNSDGLLTYLGEPDFISDDCVAHYYQVTLDDLISEVYNIGQSNLRIDIEFDVEDFMSFSYTRN